tara:strand:+ start:9368 stop:10021 length:654 start_codon:yes stop_codon:yes gene_type:complete
MVKKDNNFRKSINLIASLLIFLLFDTTSVNAQINSAELPINIDAESTGYLADESVLTFTKLNLSQGGLSISADRGEASKLDFENSTWRFEGSIIIKLENGRIESDFAHLEFEGHQIKIARIQGSPAMLLIDGEAEVARTSAIADRIDYDFQRSLIDFTGNVSIQEGGNQISSEYLVYNIKDQSIQAQSNSDDNSKVKITYTPNINKDRMTINSELEK